MYRARRERGDCLNTSKRYLQTHGKCSDSANSWISKISYFEEADEDVNDREGPLMTTQLTSTGRRPSEDRSNGDGGGRRTTVADIGGGEKSAQAASANSGLAPVRQETHRYSDKQLPRYNANPSRSNIPVQR